MGSRSKRAPTSIPTTMPFEFRTGDAARLMEADLSIHHSTVQPRKLVKNNGTIEGCCAVASVRVPSFDPRPVENWLHNFPDR